MNNPKAFKSYTIHLLEKYGVSQRALAAKSGVNFVTINRLLQGGSSSADTKSDVEFKTIERLADGLRCNRAERYGMHRFAGTVPEELLMAIKSVLYHWREFGPNAGFDEVIEQNLASFVDESPVVGLDAAFGAALEAT